MGQSEKLEQPEELEQPERLEQPTKVTDITVEYNPFHGGRKFQVEETKRRTGASWYVATMSGDFVQRGEPAVYSKYLRARMALSRGADLVVELLFAFMVSNAEDFATCGMALLTGLGVVEVLCFGGEDGDTSRVRKTAGILAQGDGNFSSLLNLGLRSSLSWPLARNQALLVMADRDKDSPLKREGMSKLLGSPNSLLDIEYCKAILRQDSPLIPLAVRHRGQDYHDEGLEGGQVSVSATRRTLRTWELYADTDLPPYTELAPESRTHIPPTIWPLYGQEPFLEANGLSEVLNFRLLSLRREGTDYTQYGDMSAEMARRLDSYLLQQVSWEDRMEQLRTRQYAYARISRALLHMVSSLTATVVQSYKEADRTPYTRILGSRKESRELLALVKQKTAIPLITRTADAPRILIGTALDMFSQDVYASHIRQVPLSKKLGKPVRNEYNQPICILE